MTGLHREDMGYTLCLLDWTDLPLDVIRYVIWRYLGNDYGKTIEMIRNIHGVNWKKRVRKKFRFWCLTNNLDAVKLIYETNDIDLHEKNNLTFRVCCKHYRNDVMEYICEKMNDDIDNIYEIFRESCVNDRFATVKWLWKRFECNKNTIDIRRDNDAIFRESSGQMCGLLSALCPYYTSIKLSSEDIVVERVV